MSEYNSKKHKNSKKWVSGILAGMLALMMLATPALAASQTYSWSSAWKYSSYSAIHSSSVTMYRTTASNKKGRVIAINAGHGTSGGSSKKTLCHPDGTAKVTGGSTAAGSTYATAIAGGTTLLDGTAESTVTLALAKEVKTQLLAAGYDVLMIRDSADTQLDNIARTVYANQLADCHISLHYDSTESDKGAFYISTPNVASYRNMDPVATRWPEHHALGNALISGLKSQSVKIYGSGSMAIDLTQTSYSTIPSVDLEVGDRGSNHSAKTLSKLAAGIVAGVNTFYAGDTQYAGTWIYSKTQGKWWYKHSNGTYTRSNWEKIKGKWYLFDKNGWMLTGWQYVGGKWYLLSSNGDMLTEWQYTGGKWYYLTYRSGEMVTGWQRYDNKWYYLYQDGHMAANTWIGNYYVNSSGVWTKSK